MVQLKHSCPERFEWQSEKQASELHYTAMFVAGLACLGIVTTFTPVIVKHLTMLQLTVELTIQKYLEIQSNTHAF
jgi:hypothetical protein